MSLRQLLIQLLLVFQVGHLAGQEFSENSFDHYTTASGLSHDYISGIAQDSTGYIWLSTSLGLNRYNGSNFVQFHTTADSLSLPSEELTGTTWLDKYRLAVCASGLHIVDTRTGITRNVFIPYHDKKYQFKFNITMTARGDAEGNIFLLTRSGFYHYNKDYQLVFRFDYYREDQVSTEHFFFGNVFGGDVYELDSKRILVIGGHKLNVYDKEKKEFKEMEASDCPAMGEFVGQQSQPAIFFQPSPGSFIILKSQSNSLLYINVNKNQKVVSKLPFQQPGKEFHYRSKLIPVDDSTFYLTGHYSGFYKMQLNKSSGTIKFYPAKNFPSYLCNGIIRDRDNNIWVATNKGLFRQDKNPCRVQSANIPAAISNSIPTISVTDVHAKADKIYVATKGLHGLLLYDKKNFQFLEKLDFKRYPLIMSLVNEITSVDSSSLLLGTGGPLYWLNTSNNRLTEVRPEKWEDGDWIAELYRDRSGGIWVSCDQIYRYDPVTRQFILQPKELVDRMLRVYSFCEDRQGKIWLCGQGLCRYDPATRRIDLIIDSMPFIKMPDMRVDAMTLDRQNNLWFGCNNNGLISYNIETGSFRQFTRSDGLPEDNIASLKLLGNQLWIACYSGIACMDLQTNRIIRFGKEDGFPDMPIVRGGKFFYDSTSQQLYIGFSSSIVRFSPNDILLGKSSPQVFIESLVINGEKNNFLPGKSIVTSWRDNEIMITIGSINFFDGKSQGFAYRIVKDSLTPWQKLGSQPSFSISNLSSGTHKIQVKSFSLNNRWPEQMAEISVVVLPPIWMKDWFITLVSGILLVIIYLLVQWRINVIRKKEKEKTHIQKLKADDYKNLFELEQISNYFSSSLAGKETEEEVLWDVTNNLMSRMHYEDCVIYLWNDDKTKMVQKAAYGPKGKPEIISSNVFEVLPGQGIVGHVIQSRQPLLVNDTRMDSRYRVDDEFRLSEVCVPIIHNDELLGILDSEHHTLNYFSDRDIKILTTIATLIGNKLKQIESEQSLEAKRTEIANINEQLAEARLAALQAQMNPHFVFNALNSIKRMILDGDNEKASRYLSKFALMIRMTLEHSKHIFVTLDENVEYLKAYLEMEQLRFNESFTYSIFVGDNIDTTETAIPSLMIQPLVENAIWHGLIPAKADKKIMISFTQHENTITCAIEDNGIGIRQSELLKEINRPLHNSMGLENLQKRIKIMNEKYDTDCVLEITDLKDIDKCRKGTRVTLRFNMVNA